MLTSAHPWPERAFRSLDEVPLHRVVRLGVLPDKRVVVLDQVWALLFSLPVSISHLNRVRLRSRAVAFPSPRSSRTWIHVHVSASILILISHAAFSSGLSSLGSLFAPLRAPFARGHYYFSALFSRVVSNVSSAAVRRPRRTTRVVVVILLLDVVDTHQRQRATFASGAHRSFYSGVLLALRRISSRAIHQRARRPREPTWSGSALFNARDRA